MDEDNSSEEEFLITGNETQIEDLNAFYDNYEKIKKGYITQPFLNKYEKT